MNVDVGIMQRWKKVTEQDMQGWDKARKDMSVKYGKLLITDSCIVLYTVTM